MELLTPQTLWKDFDTQAPFEETTLRYVTENGRKIKEFYFSGLRVDDGVVRIFARYLHNGDDLPTLVYFGDETDELNVPQITEYNFLIADYTGVKKGKNRGTMYPFSLGNALSGEVSGVVVPKQSKWYAWSSVAMYTVLYAQAHCGNGKVGVIGAGSGGGLMWKLSAAVSADVGVSLYSTDYEPDIEDLNFRAALDNRAYAPILKFPVMEVVSSNESDGSIEFMSDIYGAIKRDDCRFCINERADHVLGEDGLSNVKLWLKSHLFSETPLPEVPSLRPYESSGKLYYEVTYVGNPDEIKLYTSFGDVHDSERNWSENKLLKLGEGYLSEVKVHSEHEPIFAFVTVKEHGYKVSSTVVKRTPDVMGVKADQEKTNRLIYDGDMGADDWAMANNEKPKVAQGPFGIEGVCADKPLFTYKLADLRFKAVEGAVLQLMFCSDVKQAVRFSVTDRIKRTFVCEAEADSLQGWITKSFSAEDFKLQNESLKWEDTVTFEIAPTSGKVIVSSMLWV